jgi:hypothetical protein
VDHNDNGIGDSGGGNGDGDNNEHCSHL